MIRAATTLADPCTGAQRRDFLLGLRRGQLVRAHVPSWCSRHGWTLVAPDRLARLVSLRPGPTRRPEGYRRTKAKHLASSIRPERLTRPGAASDAAMTNRAPRDIAAADHPAALIPSEVLQTRQPLLCLPPPRNPKRATADFSFRRAIDGQAMEGLPGNLPRLRPSRVFALHPRPSVGGRATEARERRRRNDG